MGCSRCEERRQALERAARAAGAGDRQALAAEAKFVVKTSGEDLAAGFRRTVAAARAKLAGRR
jgi:phage shock protein A